MKISLQDSGARFGDAQRTREYAGILDKLPDRVLEEALLVHITAMDRRNENHMTGHVEKSRGFFFSDGDYLPIHVIIQVARDLEAMAKSIGEKPLADSIMEWHHDIRNAAAFATKRILDKFGVSYRELMGSREKTTAFLEQLRQDVLTRQQRNPRDGEGDDSFFPKPSPEVLELFRPVIEAMNAFKAQVFQAAGQAGKNPQAVWHSFLTLPEEAVDRLDLENGR